MKVLLLLSFLFLFSAQQAELQDDNKKPKILIHTMLAGSHIKEACEYVRYLADSGKYEVWMLFAEDSYYVAKFIDTDLKPLYISGMTQQSLDELMEYIQKNSDGHVVEIFDKIYYYMEYLSSESQIVREIKAQNFDLLISEHFNHFQQLAAIFEIPKHMVISLLPFGSVFLTWLSGYPIHSAEYEQTTSLFFGTDSQDGQTARSSFVQRFKNILGQYVCKFIDFFYMRSILEKYMIKQDHTYIYNFKIPDFYVAKGVDGLFNEFPLPPNQKYIYPLVRSSEQSRDFSPLIQSFIEKSKNLVYISFGTSFIPQIDVIEEILRYIIANKNYNYIIAFKEVIANPVTIKQIKEQSHILFLEWAPQKEILKLEKLKVFITHGGYNSVLEAIESKTATIAYPVSQTDQIRNCEIVQEQSIGVCLEIVSFQSLHEAFQKLEISQYYQEELQKMSKVIEKKSQESQDLIYWIDYLLAVDPEPIISAQIGHLNFLQKLDLDIKLPIILGLVIIRLTMMQMIRKFCCKKRNQAAK